MMLSIKQMEMLAPSAIEVVDEPPKLSELDMEAAFVKNRSAYKKKLKELQRSLLTVQQAYFHQKRRVIIVFEGCDAGGKGGSIRALTKKLDPRGFRVYPIAAPAPDEQGRHYLYRFQTRLPVPGNIAIFDRSYYGRVLVERVECFASELEWQRAYQEINEFERQLNDDDIRIIKIFLHITKDEQARRFVERLNNPLKRWKLTSDDLRNRNKWDEYQKATSDMFELTSTKHAPWHLIAANHKWYARLKVIDTVIKALQVGVDVSPPKIDPTLLQQAKKELNLEKV